MTFTRFALHLSFVSALALSGCGGTGPDDPLTGTWSNTTCFGSGTTPSDIEKCSVALTFGSDLTVELEATWVSMPATANFPRCTTTRLVKGQTWSTEQASSSGDTLTTMGSGQATLARADCVNMTDNMMAESTSDISLPAGTMSYQISNGTLSIMSGALAGKYTR